MPAIKAGAIQNGQTQNDLHKFRSATSALINRAAAMAWPILALTTPNRDPVPKERALSNVSVGSVLSHHQRVVIQDLAAAAATVSLIVGLVTVYWFSVMRRSYRHRLIFFLLCGDLFRSIWFFVFAWVSMAIGPVETTWKFCQVTGFFVQAGNEISDFATLFMSIHTALLVFKPWKRVIGDEGLYPFRLTVTLINVGLPILMAAIAFAHNGYGYSAQLPICTLPVRPFWYRLALMWVPRYIIWTIVLGLAVCVYRYVGGEFGTLSADTVSATASGLDTTTSTTAKPMGKSGSSPITDTDPPIEEAITLQNLPNMPPVSRTRFSPFPPKVLAAVHKAAASGQVIAPFQHRSAGPGFGLTGSEQGRVAVRDPLARPTEGTASSHPSLPANSTVQMAGTSRTRQEVDNASDRSSPSPKRILQNQSRPVEAERNSIAKTKQGLETLSVDPAFAKRRRAIIHQLRLLFIYPILYIALWLVPFILHCYQYNDYYAKYPPFVLTLLAYFSLSIMGAVNGIVFNVKERPWRHISGSDATFWGSFCWWRTRSASVPNFSSQYNEQERSNADAITSTVGGGSTMGSMSRQSAEIDSCPIALNQPPPLMRMGSFREFRTASPSAVADAGRSTFPRQQRRSEAERKQADQAYARLAAEIADRQQSQQQESLEAASISEAQSSSMVAPPARPSLNWWDRQLSGLTEFSVEDEMERQAQGEDDGSIRAKSAVPEQERQDGSAAIV